MKTGRCRRIVLAGFGLLLLQAFVPALAGAHHVIAKRYHWQREENPVTLLVVDHVDPKWNHTLDRAAREWSKSNVLDLNVVTGPNPGPNTAEVDPAAGVASVDAARRNGGVRFDADANRCLRNAIPGRIEVCNSDFGEARFIGTTNLARRDGHIGKAVVFMNDDYFDRKRGANNPHFRLSVVCHELGHARGLGHVKGRESCMTTSRQFFPETPDPHDFQQLRRIYEHHDDRTTVDGALVEGAAVDGPQPQPQPLLPNPGGPRQPILVKDLGGGWQQVTIVDSAEDWIGRSAARTANASAR